MLYFYLSLFATLGLIQEKKSEPIIWRALVLDQETLLPIEGVHVVSSNRQGISDNKGWFSIAVKAGDMITFSHIAYETFQIQVEDPKELPPSIQMNLQEEELEGVTVRSLPTEEEFKKLMLEAAPTHLEQQLDNNLQYMRSIYRLGNHHLDNALDHTYRKFSSGNGEATIFSSNPSLGIVGLIKSFQRKGSIPYVPNQGHSPIGPRLIKRLNRNDSSVHISDYFRED
ncbi:peptidase associated/transthyretin-like domain-containing protein [Anditalea andensis]|uniref:Membrane receptor RagA n=1 Tax=Anditalea andensis TaxID=1048983 RepID=A0A074LI81_9BACT|nr:hypothetical protein [Anditalea andensis]KEO73492.1 hypothetical protein EL17_11340 [Anditalea andensis]